MDINGTGNIKEYRYSGLEPDNYVYFNDELIGLALPAKISYVVTNTMDAVKGNTTNNAQKDAYVETGLLVRVPLFIEQGEKILVTTADGKYSSRA